MTTLTLKEKLVDKLTNGALTVWCEAVERAISLIDENRIFDENIYISISDTSANPSGEQKELLTYCSLEGDDYTDISYYTNLPYSGLGNVDELKKYYLLFDTMKTILEREGLKMVDGCGDGMLIFFSGITELCSDCSQ